ncbi:hypothetical protein LguiB_018303 [Lonicera macranthoides]
MPPKPSRKSKKLSQIEDNNELRLSLMQRSVLPPQPLPLVPLTDMSPPPPPPPTFEIQDLPLRSSAADTATGPAAGTATGPAADTATGPAANMANTSATASTTTSNASTGTSVARSIRCKDLDVNVSGTSASKKRRGPVIGAKTQQMVRVGGKIVVEYSDEHRGPAIEAIHSLISRDIGSCVRDRVPMLVETYAELPKVHKQIVYDYLSALCDKMKRIRQSVKKKDHCSGTTPFFFRAKKHKLNGAPAPHVEAYAEAYQKNNPQIIEKMRAKVTALVEEQRAEHPLLEEGADEPVIALPLASQVSVIEGEIGATRGTTISGLGRSGRKLPKERGGARVSPSQSILVEELKSQKEKVIEELKSQKEELKEAKERICQLEGQFAEFHDVMRQLRETREAATGSNTSSATTNDYKVVRVVYDESRRGYKAPTKVEVYELTTGSWRNVNVGDFPYIVTQHSPQALLKSVVHWIEHNPNKDKQCLQIARFGESVSLVHRAYNSSDIWVMNEYGVGNSWTKLFTIDDPGRDKIGKEIKQNYSEILNASVEDVCPIRPICCLEVESVECAASALVFVQGVHDFLSSVSKGQFLDFHDRSWKAMIDHGPPEEFQKGSRSIMGDP